MMWIFLFSRVPCPPWLKSNPEGSHHVVYPPILGHIHMLANSATFPLRSLWPAFRAQQKLQDGTSRAKGQGVRSLRGHCSTTSLGSGLRMNRFAGMRCEQGCGNVASCQGGFPLNQEFDLGRPFSGITVHGSEQFPRLCGRPVRKIGPSQDLPNIRFHLKRVGGVRHSIPIRSTELSWHCHPSIPCSGATQRW